MTQNNRRPTRQPSLSASGRSQAHQSQQLIIQWVLVPSICLPLSGETQCGGAHPRGGASFQLWPSQRRGFLKDCCHTHTAAATVTIVHSQRRINDRGSQCRRQIFGIRGDINKRGTWNPRWTGISTLGYVPVCTAIVSNPEMHRWLPNAPWPSRGDRSLASLMQVTWARVTAV